MSADLVVWVSRCVVVANFLNETAVIIRVARKEEANIKLINKNLSIAIVRILS